MNTLINIIIFLPVLAACILVIYGVFKLDYLNEKDKEEERKLKE
jgi:hypothetical protein